MQLLVTVEENAGQVGWTISSVNGKSQIGDFVQSGASINAVLLQHGDYVLDLTVSSGSGKGESCVLSSERSNISSLHGKRVACSFLFVIMLCCFFRESCDYGVQ